MFRAYPIQLIPRLKRMRWTLEDRDRMISTNLYPVFRFTPPIFLVIAPSFKTATQVKEDFAS